VEFIGVEPNPFLATVGLRVDAAPVGTGVVQRLEVEWGSMPAAFFRAVEEAVTDALRQGPCGWQVTDCVVTVTHSGYWARQSHAHGTFDKSMSSTAGDFRDLTRLLMARAVAQAGTVVCEPVHRFELEVPSGVLGPTLSLLAQTGGVPLSTEPRGASGSSVVVTGDVPADAVHRLTLMLPDVTRGDGVLSTRLDHFRPQG
jgi:ribosomal protection tetracycline resistance protein